MRKPTTWQLLLGALALLVLLAATTSNQPSADQFREQIVAERKKIQAFRHQLRLERRSSEKLARVVRNRSSIVDPALVAISACESGHNPRASGAGGLYRGLYQFDRRTWASVGGRGDPAAASPAEQTYRAKLLLERRGTAPWPICGRYAR